MSAADAGRAGRRGPGPLTGITAFRVEVRIQQYEIEPCNWATRLQDPDPPAVVGMSGTLGDFAGDPTTGQGKTVYAVRLLDPEARLQGEIRAQVEDALHGNYIAVSPAASATFRLTAQTFHEAGRSHRVVLIRIECLQLVRLPQEPALDAPVIIWAMEQVSWDPVAEACWPLLYVVSALSGFLQTFHRQKPVQWYADLAALHPGGLPASFDGGIDRDAKGDAP